MTAPAVYGAINAVKKAMAAEGVAKKRQPDGALKFPYRGIDAVMDAVASPMAEAGLLMLPRIVDRSMEERKSSSGGALFYSYVRVEYDLVSEVDGSKHTVCFDGEAFDSGDKSVSKAMSVCYRTACIQTFCIPVNGEDADADKFQSPPVQPRERPQTQQQPPARTQQAITPDSRHLHYWPLFKNSSQVNKPLTEVPTEKLVEYISRLEQALKNDKYKADAAPYYKTALAEYDKRDKSEAPKSGSRASA